MIERQLSIAPMMKHTNRHFRFMFRQITKYTVLYTEMITAQALYHGDRDRFLQKDLCENPVIAQIGGDDPILLAQSARWVEDAGYDAVNLNVGCPSERVQSGSFGACLMKTPSHVRDIMQAMREVVNIPVTIKHRIGVDEYDSYDEMAKFVETVASGGVRHFTIHARKAWLKGLSPKENRSVPPIRYEDVYRLKSEFPELWIEINGEIKTWEQITMHLENVDAVMIGRAAIDNPMLFAEADYRLIGESHAKIAREAIVQTMLTYIQNEIEKGTKISMITPHLMNLFKGEKGGRLWRQELSEAYRSPTSLVPIFKAAERVGISL